MTEDPKRNNKPNRSSYFVAGAMFSELALEIAIPAVVLSRLGRYLDGRYGTSSKLMITGFVVAFLLSAFIVWRRANEFKKNYLK